MNAATGGVTVPPPVSWKLYVPSSQSFVPKETFAVNGPAPVGVKLIENVVVPPGATVVEPKLVFNTN